MVTQSSVPSPALSPPARRKQGNRAPNELSPKCSQSQIRSSCGWKCLHLHLKHNKDTMLNGCLNMMIGKHGLVNILKPPICQLCSLHWHPNFIYCVKIWRRFVESSNLHNLFHSKTFRCRRNLQWIKQQQNSTDSSLQWRRGFNLTTLWPTYTDKHELKIINW